MFTVRIEPGVFIKQVNDIEDKLTCPTVLLIPCHHVTPRSEFQSVKRLACALHVGKSKILQAGKSNIL